MVYHEMLSAYSDWAFLFLRISLASIFLYHGWPKVAKAGMVSKGMGMKTQFVFILGLVETLSAISVLFGVYPYLGALGISVVMLGALYSKILKWKVPFSAMDKMGWEFDLILLASALVLMVSSYGFVILS